MPAWPETGSHGRRPGERAARSRTPDSNRTRRLTHGCDLTGSGWAIPLHDGIDQRRRTLGRCCPTNTWRRRGSPPLWRCTLETRVPASRPAVAAGPTPRYDGRSVATGASSCKRECPPRSLMENERPRFVDALPGSGFTAPPDGRLDLV